MVVGWEVCYSCLDCSNFETCSSMMLSIVIWGRWLWKQARYAAWGQKESQTFSLKLTCCVRLNDGNKLAVALDPMLQLRFQKVMLLIQIHSSELEEWIEDHVICHTFLLKIHLRWIYLSFQLHLTEFVSGCVVISWNCIAEVPLG